MFDCKAWDARNYYVGLLFKLLRKMRKVIGLLLWSILGVMFLGVSSAFGFSDVDDTHVYSEAIFNLRDRGVIKGYDDGTFRPDQEINRAELAKILVESFKTENYPPGDKDCFMDVKKEWYEPYVCYAERREWVEGYEDGKFGPELTVNKVESVKMILLSQLFEARDFEVEGDWYQRYVEVAHGMGLLMDSEIGENLNPSQKMTRGMIANYIYRSIDYFDETKNPNLKKLDNRHYKDQNQVYFILYRKRVLDADVNTFEVLDKRFSRDKDSVFFEGNKKERLDVETFEVLDGWFSKDAKTVLYGARQVKFADPDTFEAIGGNYARDKNFNYRRWHVLSKKGPKDLEIVSDENEEFEAYKEKYGVYAYAYATDGEYVYFSDYRGYTTPLPWIDVDTFEVIGNWTKIKDKNGIYSNDSGDDGFEFAVEECFVEVCTVGLRLDRNTSDELVDWPEAKKITMEKKERWGELGYKFYNGRIYYHDNLMYGVDVDSFEPLSGSYSRDKDNFYIKGQPFKGIFDGDKYHDEISLDGLRVFEDNSLRSVFDVEYFENVDGVYYSIYKLKDVDRDSFEVLGRNYVKDKGNVYYKGGIIEGLDVASFKYLDHDCVVDAKFVYCKGKRVDDLSVEGFEVLGEMHLRNRDGIYLYDDIRGDSVVFLSQANPGSFEVLSESYARDKNNAYYKGNILSDIDVKTFEVISYEDNKYSDHYNYLRDKNGVYFRLRGHNLQKLDEVDYDTFEVIQAGYAKDENVVYKFDIMLGNDEEPFIIEGADPKSFELLDWGYAKDNRNVYLDLKRIEMADVATFEVLDEGYARDKNDVFYNGKSLKAQFENIDPATFEILVMDYAKDKNNVYRYDWREGVKLLELGDGFEVINENYYQTSMGVFSHTFGQVEDPLSFQLLSAEYAIDKNNVYHWWVGNGSVLGLADSASFELLANGYAVDKNHAYYVDGAKVGIITDIDVDTFEVIMPFYSRDKNNFYYKWYSIGQDVDDLVEFYESNDINVRGQLMSGEELRSLLQ